MKYILFMLQQQHLVHYNNENKGIGKKEEHKKESIQIQSLFWKKSEYSNNLQNNVKC